MKKTTHPSIALGWIGRVFYGLGLGIEEREGNDIEGVNLGDDELELELELEVDVGLEVD